MSDEEYIQVLLAKIFRQEEEIIELKQYVLELDRELQGASHVEIQSKRNG